MKDQVKMKLSLRRLSQVYHSIDAQTDRGSSSGNGYADEKTNPGKTQEIRYEEVEMPV